MTAYRGHAIEIEPHIEATIHSMRVARTIASSNQVPDAEKFIAFGVTTNIAQKTARLVAKATLGLPDYGLENYVEYQLNQFNIRYFGIEPSNRKGKDTGKCSEHITHKMGLLYKNPGHHLYHNFMDRKRNERLDDYMDADTLIIAPYSTDYLLLQCYREFLAMDGYTTFATAPVLLSANLETALFPEDLQGTNGMVGVYVNSDGTGTTLNATARHVSDRLGIDLADIPLCNQKVKSYVIF
jgi:hypothetical protein